ncbi:hypothetical protein THMIRHAS_10360 [Thiosulfatimonas sediminis]|uniref:Uncharacterized protein n=1 Tax=Thiosulfatimonas sediminis TaxID=2675054 RepID=A0A6F8PU44_9GAMM|nr:hypothetical protein [Thiosulfatimonas sediminis]BBP45663.1 hypothetical protein THMIRHAS_10360 [Thiosulfatimonas sediminis]
MQKHIFSAGIMTSVLFSSLAFAMPQNMPNPTAEQMLNRDSELSKIGTLDLCVAYSELEDETQKKAYVQELDIRGQLSTKDHENIHKKIAVNSMTMCGMYMALGKPLAEQSRQIRPMTFKTVHVYTDHYYVTQSGMIVATYERKEGTMPPALVPEAPEVEPPPTLRK